MPIWSEILKELTPPKPNTPPDFDGVRRKYLQLLNNYTKRAVILYASGWLQKPDIPPNLTTIVDEDIHALMEVTAGLPGSDVDLILHSPGGSPEAAEAIVSYLRSRFRHIRVIVPQLAMSAATMIACAADEIVMGKHSFLGPTDPQLLLSTQLGARLVPAQSVLDQFDKAQRECSDPAKLSAWLPMLAQFGPDLLVQCENALNLSRELVCGWLQAYMFSQQDDRKKRAKQVSDWLAGHTNFKSHSRHLSRDELIENGLEITNLEADPNLQELSLSVFHATIHTFTGTPVVKLVENHLGRAFIKRLNVQPQPAVQIGIANPPAP